MMSDENRGDHNWFVHGCKQCACQMPASNRVVYLTKWACRLRVPRPAFELLELEALGDLCGSTSPEDLASVGAPASEAVTAQRVAAMHDTQSDRSKWLKVGAAAAAGGVATLLTAGLAAPAIVAGVGSLVGITSASAGALCIRYGCYRNHLSACKLSRCFRYAQPPWCKLSDFRMHVSDLLDLRPYPTNKHRLTTSHLSVAHK